MLADDFQFDLPDELIARHPPAARGDSRLLCVDPGANEALELSDRQFNALPALLRPDDLLVVNDVRVINARLRGMKETGGVVEVLLDRVVDDRRALAKVRASKSPGPGMRLHLGQGTVSFEVEVSGREDDLFVLELVSDGGWHEHLEAAGEVPLPPYLGRKAAALDLERYQTIYAREPGAVAAPTAGLHFSEALFAQLDARGVARCAVTLNVGAGTFAPLRHEQVEANQLHAEWVEVGQDVCDAVAACSARGGRVVAVGTTSVRALESAAAQSSTDAHGLQPMRGDTRLFITPGYRFRCVDAMVTNFHLPRSSLLMLVSAFAGRARTLRAYRHAVAQSYRFYSYGDAMFIASPTASHGR